MFVAFVYQVGGMPCEYPAPLAAIDARRVGAEHVCMA
jgi:hypothetical protein